MEIHKQFKEFIDYLNSLSLKDKDLYEQYAMMKSASGVLDERMSELAGMIIGEMELSGVEKQTFPYGTFSQTERKTWKYSEDIENKNTALKEAKKLEENSGEATYEIKKSLLFRG